MKLAWKWQEILATLQQNSQVEQLAGAAILHKQKESQLVSDHVKLEFVYQEPVHMEQLPISRPILTL